MTDADKLIRDAYRKHYTGPINEVNAAPPVILRDDVIAPPILGAPPARNGWAKVATIVSVAAILAYVAWVLAL